MPQKLPTTRQQFVTSLSFVLAFVIIGFIGLAAVTYVAGIKFIDIIDGFPAMFKGE